MVHPRSCNIMFVKMISARTATYEVFENRKGFAGCIHSLQGQSATWRAAENGHVEVLHSLIQARADLNAPDKAFFYPRSYVSFSFVRRLKFFSLSDIRLLFCLPQDGDSPVAAAAYYGQLEALKALLQGGAVVNMSDDTKHQNSPILWAVTFGHVQIVEELISARADLNTRNRVSHSVCLMNSLTTQKAHRPRKRVSAQVPPFSQRLSLSHSFCSDSNYAAWQNTAGHCTRSK